MPKLVVLIILLLVSCSQPPLAPTPTRSPALPPPPTPTAAPPTPTAAPLLPAGQLPSQPGPYAAGWSDLAWKDTRRHETIDATLWYPASHPGRDALPELGAAPYPVLIYSPGGYDDADSHRRDHEWLAQHLASHGFVVVGLEHNDQSRTLDLIERPLDVQLALRKLDAIAAPGSPNRLAGMLDMDRIGMLGVGLGAATALQMTGARLDLDYTTVWCEAHLGSYPCLLPAERQLAHDILHEIGHEEPKGLYSLPGDARIRAAVLLAPGYAPAFGRRGLAWAAAPTLVLASTRDNRFRYNEEAVPIYEYLGAADKHLASFLDGGHNSLLAPDERVRLLVTAFFGAHLANCPECTQYLDGSYWKGQKDLHWGVYQSWCRVPDQASVAQR